MAGVFTSDKRVVRDGVLIAFKGQTMTAQEAEALGLTKKESAKGIEPRKRGKNEAAAEAKELGIKVPSKATIAEIEELIAAKRAELEAANKTDPENPADPENPVDGKVKTENQTKKDNEDD